MTFGLKRSLAARAAASRPGSSASPEESSVSAEWCEMGNSQVLLANFQDAGCEFVEIIRVSCRSQPMTGCPIVMVGELGRSQTSDRRVSMPTDRVLQDFSRFLRLKCVQLFNTVRSRIENYPGVHGGMIGGST